MRTVQDVANFGGEQPLSMGLLRAPVTPAIDDCWIGGGVIRNAVWDYLHHHSVQLVSGSDVDVVYCDHSNVSAERDVVIERQLTNDWAGMPWSVRNQARMHKRNSDALYRDTEDAVRCWPETATAVAARLWDDDSRSLRRMDDLVYMIVRPTPVFRTKVSVYDRSASKDWARRWPRLTFL